MSYVTSVTIVYARCCPHASRSVQWGVQVHVKFATEFEPLFTHYSRDAVFDTRGGCVDVRCDLVAAALALDTPEATATLGGISRFGFRADSKNGGTDAGCLLCHCPTCKYDAPLYELSAQEKELRDMEKAQQMREGDSSKGKLHEYGMQHQHVTTITSCAIRITAVRGGSLDLA